MAITTRTETIAMPDGGEMAAYVAIPERGWGPGMVTVMEIFGVGEYIRGAADRLARDGYVALAPDLYRRTQPGAEFGDDLERAGAAVGELDTAGAIEDAAAALDHLRALPECTGQAGVIGFCLGGTLAFGVAQTANPSVAICYYGSGVPEMLGGADQIACPVLMHWGGEDPYIPVEQAQEAGRVAETRPFWESHMHPDGGHAFDNWTSDRFSRPVPAARAWEQTQAFLAGELPT